MSEIDHFLFSELANSVRREGFYAFKRDVKEYPHSLTCAANKEKYGYTGNSFWLTDIKGTIYLCSWGYRYWIVPDTDLLEELCLEFLSGPHKNFVPTAEMIEKYDLQEVDYEDFPSSAG